jgi:hypothetical protein
MRKQIAAANWKMNLSQSEADSLLNELFQSYTRAPGCKRCMGGKRTKPKRKSINRKTRISYGRMHHMF